MVALDNGFQEGKDLLCPYSAKEDDFLSCLALWQPDLCITAAYGNFLPKKFLDIPTLGTLNIHPSLLPKYRGAAPVNRTILNGDEETGVSILYTVLKMDAGPILAQERMQISPEIQAPDLLDDLFKQGTRLLIEKLDSVWDGSAPTVAEPQDESKATRAPKMSKAESQLNFQDSTALECHNQVRAFSGWPGSRATFVVRDLDKSKEEKLEVKILKTRVGSSSKSQEGDLSLDKDCLSVKCAEGSILEVLELQPANKKRMMVKDFKNGLGKKVLELDLLVTPTALTS